MTPFVFRDSDPAHSSCSHRRAWRQMVRAECVFVGMISFALSCCVGTHFLAQVEYSASMQEYLTKFFPALTDGGLHAVVDFNGLGDPRPRLFTTIMTLLNIELRKRLMLHGVMHPSLSINWALYPLCVVLVYRLLQRLTECRRAALMGALLYAASPALLDTLTNYYVPAKPLMNVLLLVGLYGASLLFPRHAGQQSFPRLGFALVFLAGFLGLLTDETAVFVFACIPVVFSYDLATSFHPRKMKILFGASLTLSLSLFVALAFWLIPTLNQFLCQAPLDFWTVINEGPWKSMFALKSVPAGALTANYAPGSLLETVLSVHGVPDRTEILRELEGGVRAVSGGPLPHFYQWGARERICFYVFLAIFLVALVRQRKNAPILKLCLCMVSALGTFVLIEAFLLLRLAPYIGETNYYAAPASLFLALPFGILLGSFPQSARSCVIAWSLLCYLGGVQYLNYLDTASHNGNILADRADFGWKELYRVHDRVAAGDFRNVAREFPFPSRLFFYAFELEGHRRSRAGLRIDIPPMLDPRDTLFGYLPSSTDAGSMSHDLPAHSTELELWNMGAHCFEGEALIALFSNRAMRGRTNGWGFLRYFDATGTVQQQYWREGLMRAWADEGLAQFQDGVVALDFKRTGRETIARVYAHGDIYYAFAPDGRRVAVFKTIEQLAR